MSSWEMCEIRAKRLRKAGTGLNGQAHFQWEAEAIGPSGVYIAKRSSEFKSEEHQATETPIGQEYRPDYKHNKAALDKFIAELARAGWEPIGKGERWYSYRFRKMAQ